MSWQDQPLSIAWINPQSYHERRLFGHLGEFVGEGVDDELEAIGDAKL